MIDRAISQSFTVKIKAHNERCPDCKKSVRNLLAAMFGVVEVNRDLNLPCRLEDYANTNLYEVIGSIYKALRIYRRFDNFVKAKKLRRVDFFIPSHKLIVDFDESQHFTKPRDITLSFYPQENAYGFSVQRWRTLCQELDKQDNDPPYRDEQRAWYDTLRDFAPTLLLGSKTVRLYSCDSVWCSFNPNRVSDLKTFEQFVMNKQSQ
jgi:hypothetical protein